MREIKFRGQTGTTEGKKWVYGHYYRVKSFFDDIEGHYINTIRSDHLKDYNVYKETVGQYTGLHDKNGKEIYESDIVEVTRQCIWEKGIVVFIDGCFFIKVSETLLALYECEPNNYELKAIGNIYENPDLLKGADNIE